MLHKSFDVDVQSADAEAGTFDALVAVFHNVDSVGDRIVPGAFAKTLEKWRASGDPVPVILSHKHSDPMSHIGVADPHDIIETDKGLQVHGKLDVDDNEVAKQVHRLMKRRSLKEFSFGYNIPSAGERKAKDGANELLEIDLIEVGPTLKGANPSTELHAVKSALDQAEWSNAYVNLLPDSAFLYVESGGMKDDEGKTTPRSLRHFPYKAIGGRTDGPHLRAAIAQIPEASFSDDVKTELVERVARLLEDERTDPSDEKSLRRATNERELSELMEGAPDPEVLAKESVDQLKDRVKALSGEMKERNAVQSPPSDSELRRREQEDRLKDAAVPEGEPEPVVDERMVQIEAELVAIKEALERKGPEPEPKPLSAAELRRRDDARRLKNADVPEGEAEVKPDPTETLTAEIEQLRADLTAVKAEVGRKPEEQPPDEEALRREAAKQRLKDAEVPEGTAPDPVKELAEEMSSVKASVAEVQADLKKADDQPPKEDELRRQIAKQRLAAAAVPEGEAPDRVKELSNELSSVRESVAHVQAAVEKAAEPQPPNEAELRRQAAKQRLTDAAVPEGEAPDRIKELTEQMGRLTAELSTLKAREEERVAADASAPAGEDELRRRVARERLDDAAVPIIEPTDRIKELSDELTNVKTELAELKAREPEPPPVQIAGEEELRREMAKERLQKADVGDATPSDALMLELKAQVAAAAERNEQLATELAEVKASVEHPVPSEAELRRREQADRLKEADVGDSTIPDRFQELADLMKAQADLMTDQMAAFQGQLTELKTGRSAPPLEDEQRRVVARRRLEDADVGSAPTLSVVPDATRELAEKVGEQTRELREEIARLKEAVEAVPKASDAELRRRSQEERLRRAGMAPGASSDEPDRLDGVASQLQGLTDMIGTLEKRLERIKDPTSEEPHGAKDEGHGPLRKRSEQVVLDVSSQGLSERKPPTQRDEPVEVDEGPAEEKLRKQSRDVTLQLLMGSKGGGQ